MDSIPPISLTRSPTSLKIWSVLWRISVNYRSMLKIEEFQWILMTWWQSAWKLQIRQQACFRYASKFPPLVTFSEDEFFEELVTVNRRKVNRSVLFLWWPQRTNRWPMPRNDSLWLFWRKWIDWDYLTWWMLLKLWHPEEEGWLISVLPDSWLCLYFIYYS